MAERYMVTRLWIKHKGQIYRAGTLLPEEFNHHDRFRSLYPSRIGIVETLATDSVLTPPITTTEVIEETPKEVLAAEVVLEDNKVKEEIEEIQESPKPKNSRPASEALSRNANTSNTRAPQVKTVIVSSEGTRQNR